MKRERAEQKSLYYIAKLEKLSDGNYIFSPYLDIKDDLIYSLLHEVPSPLSRDSLQYQLTSRIMFEGEDKLRILTVDDRDIVY